MISQKNDINQNNEPVDWKNFGPLVIGVDEVGRGCLAGPVYAAAVLFDRDYELEKVLTDSKKLTPKKREEIFKSIRQSEIVWAVGIATVEEIDELNILQASFLAMERAVKQVENLMAALSTNVDFDRIPILIDGHLKSPFLDKKRQVPIVKGDLRCTPISAASIMAKVSRDQLMSDLSTKFIGYGFDDHKGYLTKAHQKAIAELGVCEIHRRTFKGVKEHLN